MTKYVSLQMCLHLWVCATNRQYEGLFHFGRNRQVLVSSENERNPAEFIFYILVPVHVGFIDHKDKTCCWKLYSSCVWEMCTSDIVNKCLCCGEGSTVEQNSEGKKESYWGEKAESVQQSTGKEGQGSEWVREPTIFFSSEQYGVARGAVAHLCERQDLQHVHCIFLKTPEKHRCTSLTVCHLSDRGHLWVLLIVYHLYRDRCVTSTFESSQNMCVTYNKDFYSVQLEVWESGFIELWIQLCCGANGILFLVIMDNTTAQRCHFIRFEHS